MTSDRDEITPAIIEAVAEAEGVEPLDLSYSLNDYIDLDALEMLASRDGIEWWVQFRVKEYTVVIDGEGMIAVRPDDPLRCHRE